MRDVATVQREVEISGAAEVGQFSIAVNGKSFRLLMAGIYSDKPRAIIRELWSNAFDSHVMAGIMDRPFKCHLPTIWESEFSVRDYGVSLTHEQVMKLYTTVFQSTKEDTNSQVGKFGLGSKTPFAYTDTYTTTAILNGEKRIYNVFIDSKGVPSIALFHKEETDEEQGLEVSFPVELKDVEAFKRAAERVAMGFEVVPENNLGITAPEMEVSLTGDGWKMLKRDTRAVRSAHVRQGCVLYPIDVNAIDQVKKSEAVHALSDEPLIIDMPIGSVDITPSRESLSYDEATCKNLIAKFEEIVGEFVRSASEKIKSANTLWEAVQERVGVLSDIRNETLQKSILQGLTWRGRKVPHEIKLTETHLKRLRKHGVDIKFREGSSRRDRLPQLAYCSAVSEYHIGKYYGDLRPLKFYYWTGDTPKHLGHRLRALPGGSYVIPDFRPNSYGAKMLMAMLGRRPSVEFVDLTTIPFEKPETARSTPKLRVWNGDVFDEVEREIEPNGRQVLYVPTHGNHAIRFCGKLISYNHLRVLWDALKSVGFDSWKVCLVAIPDSRKAFLKKLPEEWIALEDEILDLIGEHNVKEWERYQTRGFGRLDFMNDLGSAAQEDSLWNYINSEVKVFREDALRGAVWDALTPFINELPTWMKDAFERETRNSNYTKQQKYLEKLCKTLHQRYPLVRHNVQYGNHYNLREEILDYVNLIDQRETETRLCDLAWQV